VLRAARDAGVKRVVLTSSFAAIGYGVKGRTTAFTEEDWTNLNDPTLQPYQKSKTIAEREAWDFIAREGGGLELTVINPVGVFGPILGPDYATSVLLVKRLLDGSIPGCPDLWFGAVDARDVADLHLKAMTDSAARGERFLATGGDFVSVLQIAQTLKEDLAATPARFRPTLCPPGLCASSRCLIPRSKGCCQNLANTKTRPMRRRGACWAGCRGARGTRF
jgi:dihydroflavonol-4-reductase